MTEPVTLRVATVADDPFLFHLYASTRTAELAATGWPEPQQNAFLRLQWEARQRGYAAQYSAAVSYLVVCAEVPVGNLILERRATEILVVDVALLPRYEVDGVVRRTAGLGRQVIDGVLAEASQRGLPVRAHVFNHNRAAKLWLRMGFKAGANDGVLTELEWQPPTPSAPAS